ncbi:MAG: SUKH-4 family immunity protein [Bacteroidales bacterium]|nr:SUKH-4 family immunity protein [Lachnoclostridium sp.]MCM1384917.1 SUKH-4 family immunity protein [Lachnoclostridium sp.]MCM1465627.1 SUKH-4 family immunity protein [Bacteroidales bacterium]
MDTFQFLKDNFELYTQEQYQKYNLSPDTQKILCEIGLPKEPIEGVRLHISSAEKEVQGYIVIGEDEGSYLCINPHGEIIAIDQGDESFIRFVNKDLRAFLDYIVVYIIFQEKALEIEDEEEGIQVLEDMREEFMKMDERALDNEENWWSVIVEQIEMGLM